MMRNKLQFAGLDCRVQVFSAGLRNPGGHFRIWKTIVIHHFSFIMHPNMKLSVIIPVYNEVESIEEILKRVKATKMAAEIVIVDDGSKDGTRDVLQKLDGKDGVRIILHEKNQGKGAAVRTGMNAAQGDILLIQDADLEYDPRDYPALLKPLEEGIADVVYGSRFLGGPRRATMFWHMLANKMLTFMTNLLYDTILSDMETGYNRKVIEGMVIHANSFNFEPEFTAKILKRHYRIYEVPITFNPRDYTQGKKIKLHDAFEAVWTLLKYRFVE
jgi:glycosyltransferase involved in cell wall biosynthesis